jgi:hypothetical protein
MKQFELWLTAAIMLSLPALGFAQATSGSTDTLEKHRKPSCTGKRGTPQAEIRKRGSGNTKKGAGNGNTPKVATSIGSATGGPGAGKTLGGSHGDDTPSQAQPKKPPRPRAPKDPDKKK